MPSSHYTNTVTIRRKTTTDRKTTYADQATGVPCLIQRLTAEQQQAERGRHNADYHCFIETEVLIGDKLVDSNNTTYDVVGVTHVRFAGFDHYEAELTAV